MVDLEDSLERKSHLVAELKDRVDKLSEEVKEAKVMATRLAGSLPLVSKISSIRESTAGRRHRHKPRTLFLRLFRGFSNALTYAFTSSLLRSGQAAQRRPDRQDLGT